MNIYDEEFLGHHREIVGKAVADNVKVIGEGLVRAHGDHMKAVRRDLDAQRERLEELESRSKSTRTAGRAGAEAKALDAFVRTGSKAQLEAIERKDMSIAGGAAQGQAFVPEVIADQIIARAIALSPLAGLVRRTTTSSGDYVRLLNLRGATASWSSETGTRTGTSTPLLREVRPTSGELFALPTFTRWLGEDSKFDVVDFLTTNVSDVFAKSLETAVLTGTGTNQPSGIFTNAPVATADDASLKRGADTIQFVTGSADLANDLISLYFALKPEYRRNATFAMSSASLSAVRKLRDADGSGFLWQANLNAGVDAGDGTLLGKRVITAEGLPLVGSSPALNAILCGDLVAGYELVTIGPMTLIRDDISVKGKISLYIAQRFAGRLADNDALKVLKA